MRKVNGRKMLPDSSISVLPTQIKMVTEVSYADIKVRKLQPPMDNHSVYTQVQNYVTQQNNSEPDEKSLGFVRK